MKSASNGSLPFEWVKDGWVALAVALLLCLHGALGWDSARQLTVTHDEYWHLPVGLLNVRTGKFGFDTLNPPLARLVSAAPLVAMNARPGPDKVQTIVEEYGDTFIRLNGPRWLDLLTAGRVANLLWSIAACVVLTIWARELYGRWVAVTAAWLWVCCPNVLAHASLVTPDVGLTAGFLLTLFTLWKFARETTWPWAVGFGTSMGLALSIKFTAVLLVPLSPVLWLVVRARSNAPNLDLKPLLSKWGAAVGIALLVLNAVHLFEGSFTSIRNYQFTSKSLARLNTAPAWVRAVPLPVPRPYVEGIDRQKFIMEHKHPTYLDGRWSEDGFRHYFALALAYKLPHALQLLVLLALWTAFRQPSADRPWRLWTFLGLPAAVLIGVSSLSGMQLGVRYVLPVLPLLMLVALHAVAFIDFSQSRLRSGLMALCLLALPLSLRHHPQHLGYFNELAGGPLGGRQHLLDSNLDWGQNLRELRPYLEKNRIRLDGLAYFGTVRPTDCGLPNLPPPPSRVPRPGWYAVSVNFVQSRPHFLRLGQEKRGVNYGEFGYFASFRPRATIGCSIDVYHLTPGDVSRWYSLQRQRERLMSQ